MTTDHLRVLVVDPSEDAADSLGLLLNHCGYDVQVAYTGVEALKIAAYHHPQVVFAELVLPDVDTALFASRLRRQSMLVAVTVLDDAKYRQWAMAHGFGFIIAKPITPKALHMLLDYLTPQVAGRN